MIQTYSTKDPDEIIILSMDFRKVLTTGETISSAVWTLSRRDEAEDTSSMLVGSVDITGDPIVSQLVQGGTNGGTYLHQPTITTSLGQVLIASASQRIIDGG